MKLMPIVAIKGRTIKVEKQRGFWYYNLKKELDNQTIELLEERNKLKEKPWICIGNFIPISKTGNGLHLVEVGL